MHAALALLLVFSLGWLSANIYTSLSVGEAEKPLSLTSLFNGNVERYSPGDHVQEKNIHVYDDRIVIDLKGASWSSYTDTNSMDPVIDVDANGLEVRPTSPQDIKIGDVIAFRTRYTTGIVIHRVVDTGQDNQGWYAKTKGDNNPTVDPGKVRFKDITGVLVGVIY